MDKQMFCNQCFKQRYVRYQRTEKQKICGSNVVLTIYKCKTCGFELNVISKSIKKI